MHKVDFLSECMSEFKNAPIDAFNKEFCMMCSNRECARSWGNNSIFDSRVKDWRRILFEDVKRIENVDYANKGFVPVDIGRIPEVTISNFETVTVNKNDTDPTNPTVEIQKPTTESVKPTINKQTQTNTPFNNPIILGSKKQNVEEDKTESSCVFVFDSDDE